MPVKPSPREQACLDAIRAYRSEHQGTTPSRRELAGLLGVSATVVARYLASLIKKGWVRLEYGTARNIRLLPDPETEDGKDGSGGPGPTKEAEDGGTGMGKE